MSLRLVYYICLTILRGLRLISEVLIIIILDQP